MAKPIAEIDAELDDRIEALGLEVVEVEWAGSKGRPILRIRVDLPDSEPGRGVTVADCVKVSRTLEPWLDEHPELVERYTLEVSSPGVERPLVRRRDFDRFAGREVEVKGGGALAGTGSSRLEGVLEGVMENEEGFTVLVRLKDGSTAEIPRDEIVRAKLVHRWDESD